MKRLFLLLIVIIVLSFNVVQAEASNMIGIIDDDAPFVEVPLFIGGDDNTVTIELVATSGDLDMLLYLVDDSGKIIAENDDDDRVNSTTNSYIEFINIPPGQYTIIATRYKALKGKTGGEYSLTIDITDTPELTESYAVSDADLLNLPEYPAACCWDEWASPKDLGAQAPAVFLQNPNPKGKTP